MTRGRRPQPEALKAAKGNPGKRKMLSPQAVPDIAASTTKPPAKLTQAALTIWRQTAPDLERMNFLRQTDRQAFARYCDALSRFWKVSEELRKVGTTYWTDSAHGKMQRINPLFIIEERLSKRLTELEDRFGLTPASRQQIMLRLAQTAPMLPFGQTQGAAPPSSAGEELPEPPSSPVGLLGPSKLH